MMWSIAKTLLENGTLERWAYVSCFCPCLPGQEEADFEGVKEFIRASVPQFQLVPGPKPGKSAVAGAANSGPWPKGARMAQFAALDQHIRPAIDDTANPPWCMIPAQGAKTVRLVQGDGLTLKVSGAASAGIQFRETGGVDGRRIEIKAQSPGEASLQAMNGQTVAATLDISVLPRKEFKIAILFVYDRGGERTGRPLSRLGYDELQNAAGVVNNIYLPRPTLPPASSGWGQPTCTMICPRAWTLARAFPRPTANSATHAECLPPRDVHPTGLRERHQARPGDMRFLRPRRGRQSGFARQASLSQREFQPLHPRPCRRRLYLSPLLINWRTRRMWELTRKRRAASFPTLCRRRRGHS